MPLPEARSFTHLLRGRGQDAILNRALLQAEMTSALREFHSFAWAASLRVAAIRHPTLVIYSASAAALVPLRQHQQAVIDFLNRKFGLECTQLEMKVRPAHNQKGGV